MAPQVHDLIDVFDRHRTDLDAGPARDAVPDRLIGDRVRDQGGLVLGEHLVAQPHDHELGRKHLAGSKRRACILAAAALGAGEGVEYLLEGQIGGAAGAEADVGVVCLEVEGLKPAARAGPPETKR